MTSTDEPMEQVPNATQEAEAPLADEPGLSRSVARALGRAARWAVNEAEVFTGSAKQVLAVGGRATTWVAGGRAAEGPDTSELLQQLKELVEEKPPEELERLEGDPEFWKLVRRLQQSQQGRWSWFRSKVTRGSTRASKKKPLLNAESESSGPKKQEKSPEASSAEAGAPQADPAVTDAVEQAAGASDVEGEGEDAKGSKAPSRKGKKDA